MYGTVARVRVKPGTMDRLREISESQFRNGVAGMVASYFYISDKDPNEGWIVAVFDSRESYWANAQSPEQDQRYREILEFMEGPPEWHDGEIVTFGGG
jgi:quinol monooxygenase YgiN